MSSTMTPSDLFEIGGSTLNSRLFIGTGKYGSDALIPEVAKASGSEVITVALRRVEIAHPKSGAPGSLDLTGAPGLTGATGVAPHNISGQEKRRGNVMDYIPKTMHLLPNTSGAKNVDEAVRIARLAKAAGCGNWIKIEVISDSRYLLPDGYATAKATEILTKEGFVVLPYINPDLYVARDLLNAGAAAVMPLGAPIGSNRGLRTSEMIRVLIAEIPLPIIVDAGIGSPSQAAEAMEMGAAACLVNTAIATSADPVGMSTAFGLAVKAGRLAYLAGLGRVLNSGASASSPLENNLTDFLGQV